MGELRHLRHLGAEALGEAAVHALGDLVDFALRQPQRFADVPDGAGVAVLDEGADHRRALGRVGLEDVAEHLVARLAAEVEVDVGYVAERAVFAEEALDREVVLDRVDAGESEQVADQRADGGAAAAHRQVVLVGVAEDVPEAQEEAGAAAGLDQRAAPYRAGR